MDDPDVGDDGSAPPPPSLIGISDQALIAPCCLPPPLEKVSESVFPFCILFALFLVKVAMDDPDVGEDGSAPPPPSLIGISDQALIAPCCLPPPLEKVSESVFPFCILFALFLVKVAMDDPDVGEDGSAPPPPSLIDP
eukprot:sb/3474438/